MGYSPCWILTRASPKLGFLNSAGAQKTKFQIGETLFTRTPVVIHGWYGNMIPCFLVGHAKIGGPIEAVKMCRVS